MPQFKKYQMLDPLECRDIRANLEEISWKQAGVIGGNVHTGTVRLATRQTEIYPAHKGTTMYRWLTDVVDEHLPQILQDFPVDIWQDPERRIHSVDFLRYGVGSHFRMHSDIGGYPGVEERKLSISILLNDPRTYEGGRLRLFDGVTVDTMEDTSTGSAIVFPSYQCHEVTHVTSGVRQAAVLWLCGPRYR